MQQMEDEAEALGICTAETLPFIHQNYFDTAS
jgi:hypothetical protein